MELFSIFAKIGLDDDNFNRGIMAAEEKGRNFCDVINNMFTGVETVVPAIKSKITELFETITHAILYEVPKVAQAFTDALAGALTSPESMTQLNGAGRQVINSILSNLRDKAAAELIFYAAKELIKKYKTGILSGAANVGKAGKTIINGLGTALKGGKGIMATAGGGIASAFTGALKGTGKAVGGVAKAGKGLLAAIGPKGWIAGGVVALGVVAYRNRDKIGSFFSSMGDSARGAASKVWDATKGAAENVAGFFKDAGSAVADGASKIVNSAREMASNVISNVRETFSNAREVGSELIDTFSSGFESRRDEGYGVVRSFFGGITDLGRDVASRMREIGTNAADSFSDGFSSRREAGQGVIRSFFGGVVDAGRDFLGINSPSRVFMDMGELSGEGYVIGLDESKKSIYDKVKEIFDFNPAYQALAVSAGPQYAPAALQSPNSGSAQHISLNVKFDDIDQVYKLVQVFEDFSHSKTVYEGV